MQNAARSTGVHVDRCVAAFYAIKGTRMALSWGLCCRSPLTLGPRHPTLLLRTELVPRLDLNNSGVGLDCRGPLLLPHTRTASALLLMVCGCKTIQPPLRPTLSNNQMLPTGKTAKFVKTNPTAPVHAPPLHGLGHVALGTKLTVLRTLSIDQGTPLVAAV